MESVGWISAIIIGGLAGWLAGKLMEARYGIFLNIVLGIVARSSQAPSSRSFTLRWSAGGSVTS